MWNIHHESRVCYDVLHYGFWHSLSYVHILINKQKPKPILAYFPFISRMSECNNELVLVEQVSKSAGTQQIRDAMKISLLRQEQGPVSI